MKVPVVLLVDDSVARHRQLAQTLASTLALGSYRLLAAYDLQGAYVSLATERIDLLVADLVLPRVEGDSARSADTGLQLLEFASDMRLCPSCPRIVGVSAFPEASTLLGPQFTKRCATVLHAPEGSNDWAVAISAEVARGRTNDGARFYRSRALILTAQFAGEFEAVAEVWESRAHAAEPTAVGATHDPWMLLEGTSGDASTAIHATWASEMGVSAAAATVVDGVLRYAPRLVVHAGICAGIGDEVDLGDVVIPDMVWDGAAGKLRTSGGVSVFERTPNQFRTDSALLRVAAAVSDEVLARICRRGPSRRVPRVHIAPMATVSHVVADRAIADGMRQVHRKTIALEMEAYGICRGATLAHVSPIPRALIVKGVSDFADEDKDDRAREVAAYNAAAVSKYLIDALAEQ